VGIVFVIHKPKDLARRAMRKWGVTAAKQGTTVFGLTCEHALAAVGGDDADLVTRRWVSQPPAEEQIKAFLFAGNGTALLTLHFEEDGIRVEKEPDVYSTRSSLKT
jgi:hypothetical protein